MDPFVKRFQPDRYEDWMQNLDIAPHPEDPPERIKEIEYRKENPVKYAREQEQKRALETINFDITDEDIVLDVYRHVDFKWMR